MSWSLTTKAVPREVAMLAITNLEPTEYMDGAARAQLQTAKRAAIEIVKIIPGTHVHVALSGHANGVGWQAKENYANDCISVTVTQCFE